MMDNLTYRDVNGKRRLYTWVKAAIFIVAALLAILVFTYGGPSVTAALFPTNTPTPFPTWTPTPPPPTATATATPEPCPSDPKEWTLVDTILKDNLKRIEPACVYDGLGRVAAWALLTHGMGYTRQEAAKILGFEEMPMKPTSPLTVMQNRGGKTTVTLITIPYHPDFAEWFVNDNRSGLSFALAGCFRGYEIVGNQRREWNGYDVVCRIFQDLVGNVYVAKLGDLMFSSRYETSAKRTIFYIGYQNNTWAWLGEKEESYDLAKIGKGTPMNELYNAPLWDADWLEKTYGLTMKPLPENWQAYTDGANMQAILDVLNKK